MGKENSTPRSDPENPKKSVDARGVHTGAAAASAGGDTTLDTAGSGAAAAKAEDRMSIGPYVLFKKLGEGGMGQVWLAEQTAPVKRQVALKLIKGGWYDSAVIQRFEAERQSLAVMNHPAIAKVFDAGSTADGQPYFVMEYVDGVPITKYCDAKKLKIRERLELFIQVCEGVQHAHQKAIIHRDLKPSNILVVEVDGKPVPRIIDFGLAKAISPQPGAEQTLFTQMGGLVGTRGFMSPEQADPSVLDVDTRTDVYSLGVILYVLLTGTLPFDPEQWKRKPFDEVLRQLREEDPPSPSTKIGLEKASSIPNAAMRATEPRQLARLLHGDLDWIAMKAIDKDRNRRYGTPSELAADLRRYLNHEPIIARPASTGYRLRKYVRRHSIGVAAAAAIAVLLIASALVQVVELRRITRERDRTSRITDFMAGMFKVSDPGEARGNTITAREILDKASTDIDTGLAKDPELQAQMMSIMGSVYEKLGLYARAESLQERALEIRRRVLGPKHVDTLKSASLLAFDLDKEAHYADAEKLERETLEIQARVLGLEHPDTLATRYNLALTLRKEGRQVEAEKLNRETLDIRRRVLGPENLDTVASMETVALDLMRERRYDQAEKLERETLEMRRRMLGSEHPDTLMAMSNLGIILHREALYAEAEKLDRDTLAIRRRVLGPEHPDTLAIMNNLAMELRREGKYAEADNLGHATLEIERRVLGTEHPLTLSTMGNLANSLDSEGRYAEAENLDREILDIRRRVSGPEHPDTLRAMENLAADLKQEGHYAEAELLQRKTLDQMRRLLGPEDVDTLGTMEELASTLSHENRYEEAKKLFHEVIEAASKVQGQPHLSDAWYNSACGAAVAGRRAEALSNLQKAVSLGYSDAEHIASDGDLKLFRGDPRFEAILADAKKRATPPEERK